MHRFAFSLQKEVLDAGQEGTRLLRAQGDLWDVCTLLGFMEAAALELGHFALADDLGEEVESLATRLGHTFALDVFHAHSASVRQLLGHADLDAFEAGARRHLEVAGPLGYRHISGALLAHVAFLRGDWEGALRRAEEAVRHSPENHHTSGMDWACYLRVLAYSGRAADVHAVLDGRREVFPRRGRPNGYGPWYLAAGAVEALWVIGDRQKAAVVYPLVREFIDTTGVVLFWLADFALLERIAGIAAAAGGHWDLAESHFRTALRQADELSCVIEGAETRRFFAQMLLDRNGASDRESAGRLIDEALPVYDRVGMPRHAGLAAQFLST
jgi:hypothetical protein